MAFLPPIVERIPSQADGLVLRSLTIADAAEAAEVIRAAFAAQSRATTPPSSALRETAETLAAKIAAGGGFGAFVGTRLVAVVLWQVLGGDALIIARVSVLSAWRGRSLRWQLIGACEEEARARGLRRARLRVRLALPENERLFSRMGYERIEIEAHPGFDAPTVAVMEKRLS